MNLSATIIVLPLLMQTLLLVWLMLRVLAWLPLQRITHPLVRRYGFQMLLLLVFYGAAQSYETLRALWGDPSITTVQLLILGIAQRTPKTLTRNWLAPAIIGGFSLIFYALCLGLSDFDPYRLGYQPALLITLLALPALWLWWRNEALWLWLLAFDVAAFALGVLESGNLWDYLLDPLFALACIILAARNYFARERSMKTSVTTFGPPL